MKSNKTMLLNAAIAGLFATAVVGLSSNAFAANKGICEQNNCKGKGGCAALDGTHGCSGKNTNKNHFFKTTHKKCNDVKGTFYSMMKKGKR